MSDVAAEFMRGFVIGLIGLFFVCLAAMLAAKWRGVTWRKDIPGPGETRWRSKFAWGPTTMSDGRTVVWLGFYRIYEEAIPHVGAWGYGGRYLKEVDDPEPGEPYVWRWGVKKRQLTERSS